MGNKASSSTSNLGSEAGTSTRETDLHDPISYSSSSNKSKKSGKSGKSNNDLGILRWFQSISSKSNKKERKTDVSNQDGLIGNQEEEEEELPYIETEASLQASALTSSDPIQGK